MGFWHGGLSGGFCLGSFCPRWGFVLGMVLSSGILSRGLSTGVLSRGFCSGGFVQGVLFRGFCSGGFVQGVLFRGLCSGDLFRGFCSGGFVQRVLSRAFCPKIHWTPEILVLCDSPSLESNKCHCSKSYIMFSFLSDHQFASIIAEL